MQTHVDAESAEGFSNNNLVSPDADEAPVDVDPSDSQSPTSPAAPLDPFTEVEQMEMDAEPITSPHSPDAASAAPVNSAAMAALEKMVTMRTVTMDATTKSKEKKILDDAKEYLKQQQASREKTIRSSREDHQKLQKDDERKIGEFKKSGAVWSAVGMLVDLDKPNGYSKGTERMRGMMKALHEKQVK